MTWNAPDGLTLTATVHVRDADGQTHIFSPGDVPPDWARAKITNPKAWGFNVPAPHGPQVDYGSSSDDLLDVLCCPQPEDPAGAPSNLIARFERLYNEVLYNEAGELIAKLDREWRWTASLAMHKPGDSAGSNDGLACVDKDRQVVYLDPAGERKVRLYCRVCRLDITRTWADAVSRFDLLYAAGERSVKLLPLIATITH